MRRTEIECDLCGAPIRETAGKIDLVDCSSAPAMGILRMDDLCQPCWKLVRKANGSIVEKYKAFHKFTEPEEPKGMTAEEIQEKLDGLDDDGSEFGF